MDLEGTRLYFCVLNLSDNFVYFDDMKIPLPSLVLCGWQNAKVHQRYGDNFEMAKANEIVGELTHDPLLKHQQR